MKTEIEYNYYKYLKMQMIAKCEAQNISWSRYYAALLDLGGQNSEQYLRNFFIDDGKRFNSKQLSVINYDLTEHKHILPFTQKFMKDEILHFMGEIGKITVNMEKYFDDNDDITKVEASALLPSMKAIYTTAQLMYLRLEETKANG